VRLHRVRHAIKTPLGAITTYSRNVFAQAEALGIRKTPEEVKAEGTPGWRYRTCFEGNRPSSTNPCGAADSKVLGQVGRAL